MKPDKYKKNLAHFEEVCKQNEIELFFLSIIPPPQAYDSILPGVIKNVLLFNRISFEIFNDSFIDLSNFPSDGIMSDYHHINKNGHKFIATILSNKIQ